MSIPLDTIYTKGHVKIKYDGSLVNDDIEPENMGKKVHDIELTADLVEWLNPPKGEREKRGFRNLLGLEIFITRSSKEMKILADKYKS